VSGPANDNKRANVDKPRLSCPICTKATDEKYRPFCSKHCADVDLARWLGGRYAIPARQEEEDEDTPRDDEQER
jgi:endogenous inhibitor of DNA gyrase (YacG/DUF329 family)